MGKFVQKTLKTFHSEHLVDTLGSLMSNLVKYWEIGLFWNSYGPILTGFTFSL